MDRFVELLRERGCHVDVDCEQQKNPADYDIVHLFNFALKDQTERLARRCIQLSVPYVVTPMYEDWPRFFNQMAAHYAALREYILSGQNSARWPELERIAKSARPSPIWDNSITANHAAVILATGPSEADVLRRDYPGARRIETLYYGAQFSEFFDGGELFVKKYGLRDFIFCVGRFELRKNQLMLLKALENSNLPLVFAGGGFSYQQEYADLAKNFRRLGPTLFLDRLEPEMLASAYQAARIHALPGWLELPGFVSLEAAWFGKNVVVADYGTVSDYLGEDAFYCDPGDSQSILQAVQLAYQSPFRSNLTNRLRQFTWKKTGEKLVDIYKEALRSKQDLDWAGATKVNTVEQPTKTIDMADIRGRLEASIQRASQTARRASHSVEMIPCVVGEEIDEPKQREEAKRICTEADRLAAEQRYQESITEYEKAIAISPRSAHAYRGCGVVALAKGQLGEAETFFSKALTVEAGDIRSQIGLAIVQWEQGKKEDAYERAVQVTRTDPADKVAILHLLRFSYGLNRFEDLERALRTYLISDSENVHMLFCLAGCVFQRKRYALAREIIDRILLIDPSHQDAKDLRVKVESAISEEHTKGGKTINSTSNWSDSVYSIKLDEIEATKRAHRYDEALSAIDNLLTNNQLSLVDQGRAQLLRADCYACKGELQQAEDIFLAYENDSIYRYRALAGLAVLQAAAGNWDAAADKFRASLKIRPGFDVSLAGLGLCSLQVNKSEEAWEYFTQALHMNPENVRALYGVIQLGYQLKRLDQTAQFLLAYLELHPLDLSMLYSYAGCCYALRLSERALSQLNKILLVDPTNELARELKDKIESEENASQLISAGRVSK